MEDFDLSKSFDELLKPTDPPKEATLINTTTEVPEPTSLESILLRLPPEGQACRWAVDYDLRITLQKLERDFGPSDNWK
jgi:hypothetical protein